MSDFKVNDRVQWMDLPGYEVGTVTHVGRSGGAMVCMDSGTRILAPATHFRRIKTPATAVHEVDVRPMTDDEIRAERLTQPAGDPWLARCTCGAEMLPLHPGEAEFWKQGHLGTRPR